jgi:serine/threonine protein kinase/tetratricopeptide (TPR) repeat protein
MQTASADWWRQVFEIADGVLEQAPERRAASIAHACGGDARLCAAVSGVLNGAEAASLLESPAVEFAAPFLGELSAEHDAGPSASLVGPYRILREIGHGGMGTVYLAERADQQFQKTVAVKLLPAWSAGDERLIRRFHDERQILAALDHPDIARLLDAGVTDEGLPWFAMEYVEGIPIDRHCDERRLEIEDRLALFCRVCGAVQYAHRHRVVHRDLKPANILVTSEAGVKLLDFGIAKLLSSDAGAVATLTLAGERLLTPLYASPEQLRGEPVSAATDVYALGVLLHRLLTGRIPYRVKSRDTLDVVRAILEQEPERPSAAVAQDPSSVRLARRLRGDLDTIVLTAMQKDPGRRYETAEQLEADVRRHLAGLPLTARPESWWSRARKFVKRHRLGVGMAAGVAPLVFAGFYTLVVGMLTVVGQGPGSLDPQFLAIAPFKVMGAALEPWREDFADLVSRGVDGAGPLRALTPTEVTRYWNEEGRSQHAAAADLGRRTGAGVVVYGQLVMAGSDSVQFRVGVLDVAKDNVLAEIERTERADRMDRVADSLSLDVIRALLPELGARSSPPGTKSLPALKAFLQGEMYLRRFALDSAIAAYDRAIALDSGFAQAYRGAAGARAWNLIAAEPYWARAAQYNRGLGLRDSLMIVADSQNLAGINRPFIQRRFALLQQARGGFPNDPDVWYELGEAHFHMGLQSRWEDARASFDRAIALDSSFARAYIHPVRIVLRDNDPDAALRYVRAYLAIPGVSADGAGMRLLSMILDTANPRRQAFERALETAPPTVLWHLAHAVSGWPDAEETQVAVARRASRASMPTNPGLLVPLLSDALVFRGHLREARSVVGSNYALPAFMELAELGAIPPETVATELSAWLRRPAGGPCERTMWAALWWATRRDTAHLKELVRREDSLAQVAEALGPATPVRPVPVFARAALSLALGDTAPAIRGFVYTADPLCHNSTRQRREVQFRLLAASGHVDAVWAFDRLHDRRAPLLLERARLAERLGDHPTALKYYDLVPQVWRQPDPELLPYVSEARAAVQRLTGERRR